ncbi:unnamed protein product [Sphacelaria rigidula]
MIETWISLVRNAACVLKSLLPKEYAVMKPLMSFPLTFLAGGATASSQLERFTGLEGFIGLLQLAGAGFNLLKGAKGLCGGLVTAEYIVRWRNALAEYDLSGEGKRREVDILSDVLARQDDSNNRRIIQGICQLVIGTGLVVLACFSWKLIGITTTATAVVILEVALGTLLVIAVAGVWKMWAVTEKVEGLEQPTASDVDVVEFLAPLATIDASWEPDVRIPPTVDNLRYDTRVVSLCVGKVVSETHLEDYKRLAQVAKKQAMLDAFLIFLNVAAFFGYGTIPLDVFFPERVFLISLLPPGTTAWWGNFIGDVAWTIEPAAMFLAPIILLRNRQAKGTVGNLKSE